MVQIRLMQSKTQGGISLL